MLLADDDSQISFTSSILTNNGNYSCYDPPTVSCRYEMTCYKSLLEAFSERAGVVQACLTISTQFAAFLDMS